MKSTSSSPIWPPTSPTATGPVKEETANAPVNRPLAFILAAALAVAASRHREVVAFHVNASPLVLHWTTQTAGPGNPWDALVVQGLVSGPDRGRALILA
jgi:hypothetical protein